MSYQIIPNIIFILAVLGILLIILKHLPEAVSSPGEQDADPEAHKKLLNKGLPAQTISKIRVNTLFVSKKIWDFVLEAKDIKPYAAAGYKMKKILAGKLQLFNKNSSPELSGQEKRDEEDYLSLIKLQPKNLAHYDSLGKYYLERANVGDAKDIYQYLVNHEPSNPEYQARLAYCHYQSKNFEKAAEHYQKSLALDSTQPNRYYNLALSLDASGKRQEGIAAIDKALEFEPQNPKFVQLKSKLKNQ